MSCDGMACPMWIGRWRPDHRGSTFFKQWTAISGFQSREQFSRHIDKNLNLGTVIWLERESLRWEGRIIVKSLDQWLNVTGDKRSPGFWLGWWDGWSFRPLKKEARRLGREAHTKEKIIPFWLFLFCFFFLPQGLWDLSSPTQALSSESAES